MRVLVPMESRGNRSSWSWARLLTQVLELEFRLPARALRGFNCWAVFLDSTRKFLNETWSKGLEAELYYWDTCGSVSISLSMGTMRLEITLNGYEHLLLSQRTWYQFAASIWHLISICNSISRDMMSSSDLLGHQTHVVHRHAYRKNFIYRPKK